MRRSYRKLVTRRGIYFVVWRPEDVAQLLINEKLSPADLLTSEPGINHHLVREMHLLAFAGSLDGRNHKRINLLSQFARKLHSSLHTRH